MGSKTEKERRKTLKRQIKQLERTEKLAGLPLHEAELRGLLAYVGEHVERDGCDHSTKHTYKYLQEQKIDDLAAVMLWLRDNGGYCDCEVVANIEDVVYELFRKEHEDR